MLPSVDASRSNAARTSPEAELERGGTPVSAPLAPAPLLPPPAPAPRVSVWHIPVGRTAPRRVIRWELMRAPAKVLALAFIAYGLLFNFSVVRGSSMSPAIHDGDRILVDHLSYLFRDVKRGDIVVLRYPLNPTLDYIKRIIGVPGDRIEIAGGRVFVNGEELTEPYVIEPDPRTHLVDVVAAGSYFVLGDNRCHSSDSREFGQVPHSYLRGKVDVRVWPPSRLGLLN